MSIYDCCIYSDDDLVLDLRLNILNNYVDYFVIVEGKKNHQGNIKNLKGEVLGVHDGIVNFTIGQRKGIKISAKEPLYVIDIIADKNDIIVGSKDELLKKEIVLKNLNLSLLLK